MFKRRSPRSFFQVATGWVYPPGGWARAARYVSHRLRRLPDPAYKIARGIACGVLVSFTPFYGLHFLMSAGLAWLIGGNVLAALLATFFGNPITFPIIAALSVELGSWMLGQENVPLPKIVASFSFASVEMWSNLAAMFTGEPVEWSRLDDFFSTVFWPYLVGGLPLGLVAGVATFYVVRPLITAYQRARLARMQRKAAKTRVGQKGKRADSAGTAG